MQPYEDMLGKQVYDRDNEKIGKFEGLYTDTDGGEPRFGTVLTGFFGQRTNFFPLATAETNGDRVVLNLSKDEVKNAPSVDPDTELTDDEQTALYNYYGDSAVHDEPGEDGRDEDATLHSDDGIGAETRETGRARIRKYVTTETTMRDGVPHKEVRREQVDVDEENASR